MKKFRALLVFSLVVLLAVSCEKESGRNETTSTDAGLAGVEVAVGEKNGFDKLFLLNEGQMGKNNASLDFLDFKRKRYVQEAFKKMNPELVQGLGDVANDIQISSAKTAWIVVNCSNLVEVINPYNEMHVATIPVPQPRYVAFSGSNAFVTSWSGEMVNDKQMSGTLYRIDRNEMKVTGQVGVGIGPEGVACHDGKVYVANGGGYAMNGDCLMIFDETTLQKEGEIKVAKNIKDVFIDGKGIAWVRSLGNYADIPSALYAVDLKNRKVLGRSPELESVRISCLDMDPINGKLYAIGSNQEFDWSGAMKTYRLYVVDTETSGVTVRDFVFKGDPYYMCVNSFNGDLYVSNAKDYTNPGSLTCYGGDLKEKWSVTTGINPGKMALSQRLLTE